MATTTRKVKPMKSSKGVSGRATQSKQTQSGQPRVRMYLGDLGDCFLLSFPSPTGDRHVMIDCGVVLASERRKAKLEAMMQGVLEATGGHLSALVLTHQHYDHLSGFVEAKGIFDQFTPPSHSGKV